MFAKQKDYNVKQNITIQTLNEQRPVVIDGRQAFVTVPQGGPITDAQGNVIGVVQQFREQKDIDKRFDVATFTSPPLSRELYIEGIPSLELHF